MNKIQRNVLLITALLVLVMVLLPPYVVVNYEGVVGKTGYGFLFDLPHYIIVDRSYVNVADWSRDPQYAMAASVDVTTLLAQVFGVLIVGGLICIAFKRDAIRG